MPRNMGIAQTRHQRLQFMRKHRWYFSILGTPSNAIRQSMSNGSQIYVAARPKISFDQRQLSHQTETISYNGRPTWEPINITFWNVAGDRRIYAWLQKHYDPETGAFGYRDECVVDCQIEMLNGLGDVVERWIIKEAHAAAIDWGELDYSSGDIASCIIDLAYARAYQEEVETPMGGKPVALSGSAAS